VGGSGRGLARRPCEARALLRTSAGDPFAADAPAPLGAFTGLVAQAIANVDAQIRLEKSRARIAQAADAARRRVEPEPPAPFSGPPARRDLARAM